MDLGKKTKKLYIKIAIKLNHSVSFKYHKVKQIFKRQNLHILIYLPLTLNNLAIILAIKMIVRPKRVINKKVKFKSQQFQSYLILMKERYRHKEIKQLESYRTFQTK